MKSKTNSVNSSFLYKIRRSTTSFTGLALIFLIFLFILSGIEVSLGMVNHSVKNGFLDLFLWSCFEDLKFFFTWLIPVYIIFSILYFLRPQIARITFIIFSVVFFLGQLSLVFYFNTTLLMLGSDLFGYSTDEIMQTVGASGTLSLTPILTFLVVITGLIFALFYLPKRLKLGIIFPSLLLLFSVVFVFFGASEKLIAADLDSDFETNLIQNKSQHFFSEAYTYLNPDLYETDIYAESYIGEFFSKYANAEPIEYLDDPNYPFLHKELKSDVLSPFFEPQEKTPNIVIIIVEGLGRAFSNRGAYLGNFTPYLDSLSTESLYWSNFLSNGGRTFAVLPSLLGSLPFSENGYLEMKEKMPNQISLLNLLKKNGYKTSFYYGGNSEFDKMGMYLRMNRIDQIIDENDFPSSYKKIPASNSGFTWGYGDKELFRYYLDTRSADDAQPRLDVLL